MARRGRKGRNVREVEGRLTEKGGHDRKGMTAKEPGMKARMV